MTPRRVASRVLPGLFIVLVSFGAALADDTDPVYRTPDPTLTSIVTTQPSPFVQTSADQQWLLLYDRPSLPTIAELSEPELKLAGYRIRPRLFGPSRDRPSSGYRIVRVSDGAIHAVTGLPEGARVQLTDWSPDGRHISFALTTDEGFELWTAELASGKARRLTERALNLTTQIRPRWMADSKTIVCTLRREDAGDPPAESHVPTGPVIQQNLGEKTPARTYQDLLANAHDEALFDYYFSSQLALVTLKGKVSELGEPGIIDSFDPSPDGRYVRVETLHRPYSYVVPASRFPRRVEILDREGRLVKLVADLPLHDAIPIAFSSVADGPRSFEWRDDAPATLVWVEALDGGDSSVETEERDRLFQLDAPFDGEARPWMTLSLRYGGVRWARGDFALVSEWWWNTRTQRTWIAQPAAPDAPPEKLWERSWEDRYSDPGDPVTTRNEWGRPVIQLAGGRMHLVAQGASPEGNRPFYDTLDLASRETTRHFRSEAPYYEQPVEPYGDDGRRIITRRESVDEPPNYFIRDLESGDLRALTDFPHPSPQLRGLTKELITYEREDGVQLSATLYLPPGHEIERDGPLPLVMWAYPQEFKSADHAGQVQDSPYRFDRVGWWSPLLYLTQGYAVLDDPQMPIVGEDDEESNDTFREQLVMSAKAAVDEVVRRGAAEPGRIAIGGHSYGAFMTANLLAHSDLFAAGIARSGAYNRTLTPFGFQAEERSLWEAPDVYFAMSPFMHADKVNEPILLIHGEADPNPGTYPMQSERYYAALKGHGAVARLVVLPKEGHGYRSHESILHLLWEQSAWLDRYVKQELTEEEEAATR